MLTRVQISNINAIDYCDINFQKGKYKYLENMIYGEKLVNPIAFYGSNGSGKSSFMKAIFHVLRLMLCEPQKASPFVVNRFNVDKYITALAKTHAANSQAPLTKQEFTDSLDSITSFVRLFFEINSHEYVYHIETSYVSSCIIREYLLANKTHVFERSRDSYRYSQKEISISESLYPTLRKLAADNHEDEHISAAFAFLSGMGYIDAVKHNSYFRDSVERDYRDIMVEKSSTVKSILSQYQEFPAYNFISRLSDDGRKEYRIEMETSNGSLSLPYHYMSSGMLNQSVLLSTLLSLPQNSVLFIDEIEDALHPITILDFIKVAKERDIQLIFSSHNTYLLQKLRPDQIIFANWKDGYSTYKKLSDIYPNIREINNIEKMYFSNMFDEEIKNG